MRLIDADALIGTLHNHGFYDGNDRTLVYEVIQLQPTIERKREKGKWIDGHRMRFDGTFYWFRQCDQCGYERNDCNTEKDTNFCPDCGANMRGEQNEAD